MFGILDQNKNLYLICIVIALIVIFILYKNNIFDQLLGITEELTSDKTYGQPESKSSNQTKPKVALYYASWCGYSRMFLPEWEKFVNYCKNNVPQVDVETLKCEGDMQNQCNIPEVEGYPTVVLHKDGKSIVHNGERNMNGLVDFIRENL